MMEWTAEGNVWTRQTVIEDCDVPVMNPKCILTGYILTLFTSFMESNVQSNVVKIGEYLNI